MLTPLIGFLIVLIVVGTYLSKHKKKSGKTEGKIVQAKEDGVHEPVHISPFVDPGKCIGSGACITACPEKEVIGLSGGKGKLVHASRCIGHGACAIACPVGAITLVFGSETRGVDIPDVSPDFQTNVPGIYISGELGGMGLIKNSITQGKEAVGYIIESLKEFDGEDGGDVLDVLIVGAGPAGIGASLSAQHAKLKYRTIDQDEWGGTVYNYPKKKIVMTASVDLPGYGEVKLNETTKEALLELWEKVLKKTGVKIHTMEKLSAVEKIEAKKIFKITTSKGEYMTKKLLLAIGRRGTPRKLGAPGEDKTKVAYRLLDAEQHQSEDVMIVGGGDSAVEAAIAIGDVEGNRVVLSYRKDAFGRIKSMNKVRLEEAEAAGRVNVILGSNVKEITDKEIILKTADGEETIPNDYIYIFAGGELPNAFLQSIGISIEKKFGTR